MGNYSELDSDAERLPEGFTRTGYDADSQTYTYESSDGQSYSGLPGNRYGHMYVTDSPAHQAALEDDSFRLKRKGKGGWFLRDQEGCRYLAPFLVLIGLYLLFVLRWVGSGSTPQLECGTSELKHIVHDGDTCWAVAQVNGVKVEDLKGALQSETVNGERLVLDCNGLKANQVICITKDE